MIGKVFTLALGTKMALDQLTLLINRCRRLKANNENGENDDKLEKLYNEIADLLSESKEKVIIKCSYEREVCMGDFDYQDYYDWIIDNLVDEHTDQETVLTNDIRDNLNNYVCWDDITITIEDKMETNSIPSAKIIKEEFLELLKMHSSQLEKLDKLSNAGFPIWGFDIVEYGNLMFDKVIKAYFTEEGENWIFWWLFEKDGDPEMKAWDEDHDEIPMETMEDLWRFVKQYRK